MWTYLFFEACEEGVLRNQERKRMPVEANLLISGSQRMKLKFSRLRHENTRHTTHIVKDGRDVHFMHCDVAPAQMVEQLKGI